MKKRPVSSDRSFLARAGASLMVLGPLLAVAGGRWGSWFYVPGSSLFLTDTLVFVGVGLFACGGGLRSRRPALVEYVSSGMFLCLLILALVRATNPSILVLRDIAPFVYLMFVPVFATAVRFLGAWRVSRWIAGASVVHTMWFILTQLKFLAPTTVPFVGVPIFSTRGDFDAMVSGLCLGYMIIARGKVAFRLSVSVIALLTMVFYGSRAGFLGGLAVAFLVYLMARRPWRRRADLAIVLLFLASCLLLVALLASGSHSSIPDWATSVARLSGDEDTEAGASGVNTANARVQAWRLIVAYTEASGDRLLFGAGAGSYVNFESGALPYLSGDISVRAAHNFAITWFSLFGSIGSTIAVAALLLLIARQLFLVIRDRGPSYAIVAAAGVAGIVGSALVGVILESPFGYQCLVLLLAVGISGGDGWSSNASSNVTSGRDAVQAPGGHFT